jgi:hypothetical protein
MIILGTIVMAAAFFHQARIADIDHAPLYLGGFYGALLTGIFLLLFFFIFKLLRDWIVK